MPKPFYGELMEVNALEEGVYPATITQVIALGHQADKKGTERSKVYIALEFPNGTTKPVNGFGINTWLSRNRPPFVGLYEIITAVEKREMSNKELKEYDIFSLIGKGVLATLILNENGYLNIVDVQALKEGENAPTPTRETIAIGVENFDNPALMELVPDRVRDIIEVSKEYREGKKTDEMTSTLDRDGNSEEIKVENIPF